MKDSQTYLPFWGHIAELRSSLIQIFLIIAFGICVSFYFCENLMAVVASPLQKLYETSINQATVEEQTFSKVRIFNRGPGPINYTLPFEALPAEQNAPGVKQTDTNTFFIPEGSDLFIYKKNRQDLLLLGPLEGFLMALKLSLWMGIVGTSPLWLYVVLKFTLPALHKEETRLVFPFLTTSFIFIGIGVLLALYVTIPLANDYLRTFNQGLGMNLWTLRSYLDYSLFLMLANAIAFELFAVGIFIVHLGYVNARWLSSQRRIMIVCAFILGALLTPPDVLTQCLLAGLLIFFYEILILYARLRELRQKDSPQACELSF